MTDEGERLPLRAAASMYAARAAALAVPLACAAYGLARPHDALVGGLAWLIALAASLAGYGYLVERATRVRVDVGLRLAWGAGAYLALGGGLLAMRALTAPVLGALIAVGGAGYAWRQLVDQAPASVGLARLVAAARRRPHVAAFYGIVIAIAAVNVLGAIAASQGNVYDDDVIYTPLVRRLLDVGNLDEPFSFRRISSYGGQTVLQAMAAVRGSLGGLYVVDGALFQIVVLLGLIGAAAPDQQDPPTRGARTDELVLALLLLVVLLLPDTSVNTGSYWTGVALFLGAYRTVGLTNGRDDAAPRLFAVAGALATGACTLRQSYLPVAALFLGFVLVARWRPRTAAALRADRAAWAAVALGGALALAPYCIATWQSNRTFLYPFWLGTFNPNVQMQPTVLSPWQELQFFLRVLIEPDPFRVMLPLLPVLCLLRDRRRGAPLTALSLASVLGFVLLVHSFTLSNSRNLWRYSFGYTTTLFIVLVLAAGQLDRERDGAVQLGDARGIAMPVIARFVVIASLLVHLAVSARGMAKKYADMAGDLPAAAATFARAAPPPPEARLYADLQRAVPAGAALAIMLDEPFYLDFARNPIINLDTPGFASLPPGMPFFRGPAPVVDYFRGRGVRYLAFVRGDRSRYMYRRDYWLHRLLWDTELWRIQGAYAVDCIDTFTAIAAGHALRFERDGLVVVDLESPR